MRTQQSTSAYQSASASGATQAGLLQLVYGSLAQDLLRAARAVRDGDIEARCAASNHALLLLGHLESWLDNLDEPHLAESLQAFYSMLRTAILHLQAVPDAALFESYAQAVLDTRAAWQVKESSYFAASTTVGLGVDASEGISFLA